MCGGDEDAGVKEIDPLGGGGPLEFDVCVE